MDKFFDSMLQEIDRYTGTVNLEGENIIPGCREMTKFLKEKMVELKDFALSHKFKDDAEEIQFFKYQKPLILGRLLYFYKHTRSRATDRQAMSLPQVIIRVR